MRSLRNTSAIKPFPLLVVAFVLAAALQLSSCAAQNSSKITEERYTEDFAVGWTAYEEGDCKRSATLFSALLHKRETPPALHALGLSLALCGDEANALLAFKKTVTLAPGVPDFRASYAKSLFLSGAINEAERQIDAALKLDPINFEASMGKVAIYLHAEKAEEALPILSRLQQSHPAMPHVRFNRAIAMYQMGLYTDAESILSGFLAEWPEDSEAWNALGVVRLHMNQLEKALEDFSRAVSLNPTNASYYFNRGDCYRRLKKLESAKDDYTRSVLYSIEPAGAYLNRGEVRFLLGEKEEACTDLQRACKLGFCERLKYYRKAGHCKDNSF